MKPWLSILVLLLLVAGAFRVFLFMSRESSQKHPSASSEEEYLPGELLVKFKPTVSTETRENLKSKLKVSEERFIESISVYHWKGEFDVPKAIEELKKTGQIIYAEPNYRVHTQPKK